MRSLKDPNVRVRLSVGLAFLALPGLFGMAALMMGDANPDMSEAQARLHLAEVYRDMLYALLDIVLFGVPGAWLFCRGLKELAAKHKREGRGYPPFPPPAPSE